jgi:hypothetical protein
MKIDNLEKTLREIIEVSPITPHIFLECIVPVAEDVRPASLVFMDQFNQKKMGIPTSLNPKQNHWYKSIEEAARKYAGVHTDLLNDFSVAGPFHHFPRLVFYNKKRIEKRIRDLKGRYNSFVSSVASGRKDLEIALKGMREEGLLLGTPQCCADRFIKNRGEFAYNKEKEKSPEAKTKNALRIHTPNVNDISNLPVDQLVVFWAHEIYPCRLDCQQAKMKGYEILGCFGDQRFAECYKDVVMVNNAKVLHTREAVMKEPTTFPSTKDLYERFNKGILDYLGGK